MECKESISNGNQMSGYILGLSSSIQDLIGEIEEVIGSHDFASESSPLYLEDMIKVERDDEMAESEKLEDKSSDLGGTYDVRDKVGTALEGLQMQMENLQEEISNIQKVVELEHSEKISAFNRVGELVTELKKNQDILVKQVRQTNYRIDRMEDTIEILVNKKLQDIRNVNERQMRAKFEEVNKQWEVKFDKLQVYWEDKFSMGNSGSSYGNYKSTSAVQVIKNAPKLEKMAGKNCSRKAIRKWIEQAKACVNQLDLVGVDAVEYVKDSLLEPALTRMKHAKPKTLCEMEQKLLETYVENKDDLDKRELWCAEQEPREDVWDFLDRINDMEEEVGSTGKHSQEREAIKCMIFEKGLRNRRVGCDLKQKLEDGSIKTLEEAGKYVHNRVDFHKDFHYNKTNERRQFRVARDHKEMGNPVRCWTCGAHGHLSYACQDRESQTNQYSDEKQIGQQAREQNFERTGRFSGKCWTCGEEGHPFFKCKSEFMEGRSKSIQSKVIREVAMEDDEDIQENL